MELNHYAFLDGCFTTQIYLQGRTLSEIEVCLGFHQGRLSEGAWFMVASELPSTDGFEFAGYTLVATHHMTEKYGKINQPEGPWEKEAYERNKKEAVKLWKLFGKQRLVKVLPTIRHSREMDMNLQYRPGSGVPQWMITKPVRCRAIAFVNDYPGGRFIPDEGYVPVRYK
jgi:hypothetical protein